MRSRIFWSVLLFCAAAVPAAAQNFPERPLRIIVAFSTGTAADIVARQIALKLTDTLGKQVIVENRDGAAGTIGAGLAARATPDGHTMLIASPSIIVSPLLIKDLPYEVSRDFSPVALMATFPTVLVVGAQTKAGSVKELLDLAKAAPGKLNYANAGRGTASHLSAELMRVVNEEICGIGFEFNHLFLQRKLLCPSDHTKSNTK